ncbi:DNA-binding PadR family transcriptional regulator [Pullulanibacillus pueri]|uniref:PadR family transcriptional regulator n=1 Tax=Pullulanibacillus pueri TaxID=1437324 RepID=A0A8J3A066_9BACL|nr:PadR family transcriptional regulator [Pullulanibacillus pueri]MBM7683678.1 DNA-binding PadR family transcriptional regulator [Pullulanibacillus pueri]GGH87141.1 PadR family transcriptional regulator [Pullulanibacillus pueri]
MDKEIQKGSIDVLLLSLLAHRDMYGYEIVKVLKQMSEDLYRLSEGTLYSALKRFERKGWIESYWQETEFGRRKYYKINEEGKRQLEKKRKDWQVLELLIRKTSEGLI